MKKLGLGTFIGITMALCATVRSIPTLAATGWLLIAYMIFAVLFMAIPICAMAGELSTMLPGAGGPQLWVKTALGEKWGFVAAWLLWVQMFPGMVMVASVLGPTLGNTFGNDALGNNNLFILGCILVTYWIITILNLKFDMGKIGGQIGVWLGVYIPVIILFIMGVFTTIKIGVNPHGNLGTFAFSKLIPTVNSLSSFQYLAAVVFIFVGIEISSVYIPRLEEPEKNYTRGVFISCIGLIILNTFNAFLVANVVPNHQLQLANITQPILIECQYLGWPPIIANIFSFMVFIGVLLQLSAWVTGPSKAVVQIAKEGLLPPSLGYHKENKYGVAKNVVLTQSIVISFFALLYGLINNVNGVFLVLTNATTIVYCIVYILIAISVVVLRKKMPDADRPYRIGKSGNGLVNLLAFMIIFCIVLITVVTLIATNFVDAMLVVVLTAVLFILPLFIYAAKKPEWRIESNESNK